MSEREPIKKLPVSPVYRQKSPNQLIDFGPFNMSVAAGQSPAHDVVEGRIRLQFLPRDELRFEVPDHKQVLSQYFARFHEVEHQVTLTDFGKAVDVHRLSYQFDKSIFTPSQCPLQIRPDCTQIRKATFHLFNWPLTIGPNDLVLRTGKPPYYGAARCGHIPLAADGWKIALIGVKKTSELVKALDAQGGFVITHVGSVERDDGELFTTDDLLGILTCLQYFFSFALGRWNAPSLTVGYDSDGAKVFEQLGLWRATPDRWVAGHAWFDAFHTEMLTEILPGFVVLWNNPLWRQCLTELIYWYVTGNQIGTGVGIDSALLFTQAALELLAWTYCVQDRKMVSKAAFAPRGLNAADRLRLLAVSLNIPTAIPLKLTALHQNQANGKCVWEDSMHAITDLRNGLVHPGKDRKVSNDIYYEAWKLSQWYIELCILRLCAHNGKYANRLGPRTGGQVENVPWIR